MVFGLRIGRKRPLPLPCPLANGSLVETVTITKSRIPLLVPAKGRHSFPFFISFKPGTTQNGFLGHPEQSRGKAWTIQNICHRFWAT
jgi:hypothetical protein